MKVIKGRKYFTGKPCKAGHVTWRWLANGGCTECHRIHVNADRAANPQKRQEQERKVKEADPDLWKKKAGERTKRWIERHPERARKSRREAVKKYARANPEKIRAYQKKTYSPEGNAASHNRRRARVAAAEGSHTKDDLKRIAEMQKHRCALCKVKLKPGNRAVDHIMPLCLGGSNNPSNLQWLCFSCNCKKQTRHPIIFSQEIGLLL